MVVLDTNVLSELMKPEESRSTTMMGWLRDLDPVTIFIPTPALAELRAGVEALPDGARRRSLDEAIERLRARFGGRILPFGTDAAWVYGQILGRRKRAGKPTSDPLDLQIAAIARVARMAVATRNVMDFQECGVEVIDPWTASSP